MSDRMILSTQILNFHNNRHTIQKPMTNMMPEFDCFLLLKDGTKQIKL